MRTFSLIACCLCFGMCHASSSDKSFSKKNFYYLKEGTPDFGPLIHRAFGRAVVPAKCEPLCLKSGDVFTSLEATKIYNMTYADGVFTIERKGEYRIHYAAEMRATKATAQTSITLGVIVNGEVVHKKEIFAVPSETHEMYPFLFSLNTVTPVLILKEGDEVSLKVINMLLPEDGQACVICGGDEERSPISFSVGSIVWPVPRGK